MGVSEIYKLLMIVIMDYNQAKPKTIANRMHFSVL